MNDIEILEKLRHDLGLYADGKKVRQGQAIENLLKERQEDKEKIKELETIIKMQEYRINEMDIPKFLVEEKIEYKKNLIFEIENITLFKKLNEVERRKIIELKIEIELLKELLKCGGNNV